MTVFKAFLKVLNKCKVPIIIYTVILVFFSAFNMQTSEKSVSFTASKPNILIVNKAKEEGINKSFINYLNKNSNVINIVGSEEKIDDALFYRDVSYVIYVPENFSQEIITGKSPEIKVKTVGDYGASLANMMVERYLKIANVYSDVAESEEELVSLIDDTLATKVDVKITSKLDSNSIEKAAFYYNFLNYCILAGTIYVICLILSSFKEENIKKRTMVSSMSNKKYNTILLLSNGLFAFVLWIFYVVLSFILLGKIMNTMHGLFFIINSFIFTFCALTIAFLIANLVSNKNAVNGIVNVIALGSSFLCGSFVPTSMLPNFVLKIAHALPSYWYIKTNDLLKEVEVFNVETINPILTNMFIIICFSIIFIIITNMVSIKRKGKI